MDLAGVLYHAISMYNHSRTFRSLDFLKTMIEASNLLDTWSITKSQQTPHDYLVNAKFDGMPLQMLISMSHILHCFNAKTDDQDQFIVIPGKFYNPLKKENRTTGLMRACVRVCEVKNPLYKLFKKVIAEGIFCPFSPERATGVFFMSNVVTRVELINRPPNIVRRESPILLVTSTGHNSKLGSWEEILAMPSGFVVPVQDGLLGTEVGTGAEIRVASDSVCNSVPDIEDGDYSCCVPCQKPIVSSVTPHCEVICPQCGVIAPLPPGLQFNPLCSKCRQFLVPVEPSLSSLSLQESPCAIAGLDPDAKDD